MISRVLFFIICGALLGIGLALWIRSLPGISPDVAAEEITPQLGEEIFWGKGNCHICHKVGERGAALRGPNLGNGKDGPVISQRAAQRAGDAGLSSALAYIIQAVTQPNAYIVPGYSSEMPEVYKPPISLTPGEIRAVIKYLATIDGKPEPANVQLPTDVFEWLGATADNQMKITGDAERGRRLFFDKSGPAACVSCHQVDENTVNSADRSTGPDLSNVAAIRTPEQLLKKLTEPGARIVSGYEKVLVRTRSGTLIAGIIDGQDSVRVRLKPGEAESKEILRADINRITPQGISAMPANYDELLSEQELLDLVAYLLTLK